MRFSTSAFAPACTSPNHCEADPLRLYPDASDGEAAVTRYRVFPGMELDYRDVHARACRELRDGSGERLEIHHCLEGRVEYRQNGRYFYLSPGDLAVARTSSLRTAASPPAITTGSPSPLIPLPRRSAFPVFSAMWRCGRLP